MRDIALQEVRRGQIVDVFGEWTGQSLLLDWMRKRRVKGNSGVFGLNNRKMVSPFPGMGRPQGSRFE